MAAAALRIINVIPQPPDLRKTRQRQQEISGPGVIDLHILELRKRLEHLRSNDRLDVRWVPRAIHHAATENQTLVACQSVVIKQVVAVFDTIILWQQAMSQFITQWLGGDHLRTAGHRLGCQLRHQIAQVSIARHDNELGPDLALRRMHNRTGATLDAHCWRLLVNHPAQRPHSRRFAQRQIERMNMPTAHVQHATHILIASHHLANTPLIQQLQLRMTETLP